ncbi:type VI secretion system baseplate subunit TssG [Massilia sp. PWRC2]|uniref:type VI secretion system baseplate subunit TssG n=1 Tax=Massilia sp. PWRC2 TaxID=2804626 RepID=UPI003CF26307
MQAKERLPAAGVIDHLFDEPAQYQFRQALRLLLLWLRAQGVSYDDAFKHVLRFQNSVSLAFPASEIEALKAEPNAAADPAGYRGGGDRGGGDRDHLGVREQITLTPAFIGLLGASGSLPLHYSERIAAQQLRSRDGSARAFLDLLSNRMVGLFFEASGKYRLETSIDTHGVDPLRRMLGQLGGFKDAGGMHPASGSADIQARFAAAFRTRPVSSFAVADALGEHFGVPVELEQFVGCWDNIGKAQQTILGHAGPGLGHGAALGKRIWRCDLRIRLNIGPLDAAQRDRCLPSGAIARDIKRMLQCFGMSNLDCEVRLLLKPACVRPAVLSANKPAPDLLGWGSFLATTAGSPANAAVRYLFKMHDKQAAAASAFGQVAANAGT